MLPTVPIDPRNPDASLVVVFSNIAELNPSKTAAEGRPIYEDKVVCTIRAPGMRANVPVQPAFAVSHWVSDPETGEQRTITYAERFAKQFQQFKARQQQTISGTPLDFAPFLTEAKRAEMRALSVYTVEQLASMDGEPLKNLGIGGRDLKNRAQEYLATSKESTSNTVLITEMEAMKSKLSLLEQDNEALKARVSSSASGEGQFAEMSDEQIRDYIKTNTGQSPVGNLNRKTLVRMATMSEPSKAA